MSDNAIAERTEVILDPRDLPEIPAFPAETPEAGVACLLLVSSGFTFAAAGRVLSLDPKGVRYWVDKLDPDRTIRLSPTARLAILGSVLIGKACEALSRIDGRKLDDSSARDLMTIAGQAVAMARDLAKPAGSSGDAADDLVRGLKRLATPQNRG